ncbi:TPA: hypothetical protein DIV48_01960 [Candidatus Kaiserbacteria bacterium]|nr:MAG: Bifunctional protein FolD [Parcubacteria group bacterium GW2011_GWA1_56_13]KKW45877.1 MAG: Bifunctional protein FolD [Parcubacteria group bacterium GW2011_GWB1_57_6]HCR52397.1 hypothetical protein [Candidatus Kaiserbacteria bacterium]
MIVDGRSIARKIFERTKARAQRLPHPPKVVALAGSKTLATRSYLKIKSARAIDAGCVFEARELKSPFGDANCVLVQLPLPSGTDQKEICDSIPLEKDADVLSTAAREKFRKGAAGALLPPVVAAMRDICALHNVEPEGKKAAVVGKGWLVGDPAAVWLRQQGAEVSILTSGDDLSAALRAADIIVSGAGSPRLITPDMLKEGVVLIDAGTSESGGIVVGDADPACATKCSLFTPVPGGVGPVAVACLFENAVILTERGTKGIDK